jgi:DNA-binding beta-propeller fold protein YncE
MAVANDGSRLYVVDKTNSKIVPVNLENLTIGTGWSLAPGANTSFLRLSYMRTNGAPVLVVADGAIHGATDGTTLATFAQASQISPGALVTTSLQGNAFCAAGCRSLDYSAVGGGTFSMASLAGATGSRDIALSPDGSRVYNASGAPYYCTGESTATGAVVVQFGPDRPYPGNVEAGPDGRIYCGRYATTSGDKDVYVFDSAGTELGSVRLAGTSGIGLLDRQLLISGDGLRVIGLDPALKIVTAP